jgi:hypothetical protein
LSKINASASHLHGPIASSASLGFGESNRQKSIFAFAASHCTAKWCKFIGELPAGRAEVPFSGSLCACGGQDKLQL